LSDPAVEWHSFLALSAGGVYRGFDGTRQYMSDLDDAFEIGRAEVDEAVAVADVVVLFRRPEQALEAVGLPVQGPTNT
jgi:hypothetical protein